MPPSTSPVTLNHLGLSVPDIFAAIDWYGAVFGLRCIMGPRLLARTAATHETPSVFGPGFRRAYQAHLLSANGVGLELFQFVDPPLAEPEGAPPDWRRGLFHLCVTDPDIAGRSQRLVAHGGKLRTDIFTFVPGRPWQLVYCEDPWGNVIEIFSHSYAEVFANWPQPGMSEPPTLIERTETGQGPT